MITILRYFIISLIPVALVACSTMGSSQPAQQSPWDQAQLTAAAAGLLQQQMAQPAQKQIPQKLIANARCIAVFPSIIKAGFIVGADHGKGLVTCHASGGDWSQAAPVVYAISGGSVGLQAGAQKSSVILLFETRDSMDTLLQDKVKLGARVGVAAGPVGLNAHLAGGTPAPVLAYVTSKTGLFAGVDLDGHWMSFDQSANASIYGQSADKRALLLNGHAIPQAMTVYSQALQRFTQSASE